MKHIIFVFFSILLFSSACNTASDSDNGSIVHITAKQAYDQFQDKPGIILDVRTPEEYQNGHVKNAILANFYDEANFESVISKIPNDTLIYVICKSGGRSKEASYLLAEKGAKKIINIKDGFDGWKSSKLPFE